jgi:hypothetical protein
MVVVEKRLPVRYQVIPTVGNLSFLGSCFRDVSGNIAS